MRIFPPVILALEVDQDVLRQWSGKVLRLCCHSMIEGFVMVLPLCKERANFVEGVATVNQLHLNHTMLFRRHALFLNVKII